MPNEENIEAGLIKYGTVTKQTDVSDEECAKLLRQLKASKSDRERTKVLRVAARHLKATKGMFPFEDAELVSF